VRWNSGRQPGAFKRIMTVLFRIIFADQIIFILYNPVLVFSHGAIAGDIQCGHNDVKVSRRYE
jgi:hypothetical protein